jgi:tetratricopeptide (TPR) repeat protein
VRRPSYRWLLLGIVFLVCVGFGIRTTASRRTTAALERGDLDTAAAIQNRLAWLRLDDAEHRYALAHALEEAKRPDDAVAQFQRGLALRPDGVQWAALGNLQRDRGDLETALVCWEHGFALDHNTNWLHRAAKTLIKAGQIERGYGYFERAVLVDPPSARVHIILANKAEELGLPKQQIEHLRAAIGFGPKLTRERWMLAWLLASQPDPQLRDSAEAVRLAEALANESSRQDAYVLDLLAAALASDGRFEQAVVVGAEARDRASANGEGDLAASIQQRLALYRSGQAYSGASPAASHS